MSIKSLDSQQLPFEEAAFFCERQDIKNISYINKGLINTTYLVEVQYGCLLCNNFILQKINSTIFKNPEAIVLNQIKIFNYLSESYSELLDSEKNLSWQIPRLLSSIITKKYFIKHNSEYWRALNYINPSVSLETLSSAAQAYEIGNSLSNFHKLSLGFPTHQLSKHLNNFHNTPYYLNCLRSFKSTYKSTFPTNVIMRIEKMIEFINLRESLSPILINAIKTGDLKERLIHGDPKVDNFLFDSQGINSISIVDFDTSQNGLLLFDLADSVRSCCNPAGEDPEELIDVSFNLDYFNSFLKGYTSRFKDLITASDYYYLFKSVKLMPYELGIRFLSDELSGNLYFKTKYPFHNLYRAEVQFKLLQCIEDKSAQILEIIRQFETDSL